MPTYDSRCPANGRVIEVSHKMAEQLATWGDLCRKSGIPLDGTPGTARVHLFQARKKIKKLLEKDHAFLQRC